MRKFFLALLCAGLIASAFVFQISAKTAKADFEPQIRYCWECMGGICYGGLFFEHYGCDVEPGPPPYCVAYGYCRPVP